MSFAETYGYPMWCDSCHAVHDCKLEASTDECKQKYAAIERDTVRISKSNMMKLTTLIKEAYELSNELPNLTRDIINTNINFRLWILNNWIDNPKEDIDYDIE